MSIAQAPSRAAPDLSNYPVRDYVASMSAELALMAHDDGDGLLAKSLEVAAELARRPA
jgi:hypothetical protein